MGHQASALHTLYPYMDCNVGHQPRYIKMNVGYLDHARRPPVYIFLVRNTCSL